MTTTAEQVESPSTSTLPPPSALLLPFSRVKRIMKEDHQVDKIAQDAVIAVAAATEAFLVDLSSKAGLRMKQEQRKTLQYKDLTFMNERLGATIQDEDRYIFLDDIIPPTVPVQEALARRQQAAKQAEENCM